MAVWTAKHPAKILNPVSRDLQSYAFLEPVWLLFYYRPTICAGPIRCDTFRSNPSTLAGNCTGRKNDASDRDWDPGGRRDFYFGRHVQQPGAAPGARRFGLVRH